MQSGFVVHVIATLLLSVNLVVLHTPVPVHIISCFAVHAYRYIVEQSTV